MSIGKGILVVFFIMLASGTFAQVDPDPNGIGIYFDPGATEVSILVPETAEIVYLSAYLILTNPAFEGELNHWAAYVSTYTDNSTTVQASIWGSPIEGHNVKMNMPGSSHWGFEVLLGDSPPYLASEITVLAELEILVHTFTEPINLYVWEGAFYSVEDSGAVNANPSSGDWDLPVATINGLAPVAVESDSWGGVKALFR